MMDRISALPDELLLRILSLMPNATEVVATMVLSKRWKFLWMMVPRLVYDDSYQNMEYGRFSRFVDRSLALNEAPVLETLHFKLGHTCGTGDIRVWIRAADKCSLRELIIEVDSCKTPVTLPGRLYSGGCRMLVTLKLSKAILVDDITSPICFQSLKKLSLIYMKYPGDQFVNRFLSGCLVLEDLVVKQGYNDNVAILSVRMPSLKSLVLNNQGNFVKSDAHGFFIDAPNLKCLDIAGCPCAFCVIENNMPNISVANVVRSRDQSELLLGSITSVKRLYRCLPTSKDAYPVGSVFNCLVHLKMCTCETEWLNLLMCMLRDSPNLRALKLNQCHSLSAKKLRPCWKEPSSFPEYLLSSLEMFEWVRYEGTEEEKQVAAFILRSASSLKKATISSKSVDRDVKFKMLMELSLLPRRSPACQLAFI